jgi:O-antigen/teichoic acid export membrane protein
MRTFITNLSRKVAVAHFRERLRQSPLAHRLARGAFWSLVGAVSTRLLTLASSVIVVRLLGKPTFGEFGIVQSTLAMLGTFAGLGLGITATKYTAEFRTRDPAKVGRVLSLIIVTAVASGLLMAFAGWVGSRWLAERVLDHASLAPYVALSSLLVVVGAIDGVFSAALAGFEAFRVIAHRSIVVALINPLIIVPLVYFFDLYGAVIGLIISQALQMVLDGMALARECRTHKVSLRIDWPARSDLPVLVHYALPALGASVVTMPATWLVNIILVRSDAGFAGMSVVGVVTTLKNLATYLPTVLLAPMFAVLANVVHDPASVRKTLRFTIGFSALAVLPAAFVIGCLGDFVLGTLYGPAYSHDGAALALGMFVAGVQGLGSSLGSYLNAIGRMWLGLGVNLLWGVMFVLFALALVPNFGALGYMGAMALSYFILVVVIFGVIGAKLPAEIRCYPLLRVLTVFVALMGLAVFINKELELPAAIGIAVLVGLGMAAVLAMPLVRRGQEQLAAWKLETMPIVPTNDNGGQLQ